MPEYFYVEPEGVRTHNIENLYSYIGRLANAHGVTSHQLVEHMNAWATGESRIANYAFSGGCLALCGTGDVVRRALNILDLATGCGGGLRAMTFLALADVTSRTAVWIVKQRRAWCPACFQDSIKAQTVLYDRLYWASAYVMRCLDHKIALESRCPKCQRHQVVNELANSFDHCRWCGSSLIAPYKLWVRVPYPSFGETDVIEMISHIARNPEVTFERNAIQRFFTVLRKRQVDSLFGTANLQLYRIDPTHLRTETPAFVTLLRCAAAFDIPLLSLLENPEEAALHVTQSFVERPPVPFQPRFKHSDAIRHSLGRALVRAIRESRDGKTFSLARVCETVGVTKGYARYHYPKLCSRLVNKRSVLIERLTALRRKTLQVALKNGLYQRYLSGELHSIDHLIGEMVRLHRVSHSMARFELRIFYIRLRKKTGRDGGRKPRKTGGIES